MGQSASSNVLWLYASLRSSCFLSRFVARLEPFSLVTAMLLPIIPIGLMSVSAQVDLSSERHRLMGQGLEDILAA